jgi:hypothetical protein
VAYGDGLEIRHRLSQTVVLRSKECFCVSCPKPILKLIYRLVLTRVVALVSKMLAKNSLYLA